MPELRDFICVTCPVGCKIEAQVQDGQLVEVVGNACKRGVAFVQEELTAPKRTLTTTVRVRRGRLPLVPVRSVSPLPKDQLLPVAAALRLVVLDAPVHEGQLVLADALGTGVDIRATRDLLGE